MSEERKSGSKFSGLLTAARGREEVQSDDAATFENPATLKSALAAGPELLGGRRRGRPPGKRSDPDFEQVTAYIRSRTHREIKIALLREGAGREFSQLVEELLAEWLKARV